MPFQVISSGFCAAEQDSVFKGIKNQRPMIENTKTTTILLLLRIVGLNPTGLHDSSYAAW